MLRVLIVALSVVIGSIATAMPTQADVKVYLGVPFHSYQVGPGWRYHGGYGWYDYSKYGDFRHHQRGRLTCSQARRLVDRRGYHNVDARDCSGRTYSFRATNRHGKRVTVYVNAYTGNMWR